MDFFEVIEKRCSIREYSDHSIDSKDLEKIINAGRLAPTARCVEPWEFVVIRNKDTLAKIANVAPNGKFIEGANCAIIILCKETKYYLEDGCAATENILLAATALGIGTCWIAGDKKDYSQEIIGLLGATEELRLISIIALGYPNGDFSPKQKRSLESVIHFDKF
ncbi:MAG: nitroreductase family protein [Parcubacteria group bacterium]|nr:nitroreductase family protein [Parcubacteria group bacterium]